jgi:peroxidase
MASFVKYLVSLALLSLLANAVHAQLSPSFYANTCPSLPIIVRANMIRALSREARLGASILRLFFHDCFVLVRIG